MQRVLSTVTLLGLLVATAAAFAITEHLKLIKSPIFGTEVTKLFSPVCHCRTARATISVRLRHPDRLTVTIQNASRHTVATLASDVREPKGRIHFPWDGRTDAGGLAPDGAYRPEIHLSRARRTILLPNRIVVDTRPPKVLSASLKHAVFSPGHKHTVAIHYVLSEQAHVLVYLGRRLVVRTRSSRTRDAVKWNGKRRGHVLPAGSYVLTIRAVDLAGNLSPKGERKQVVVTIRYLALTQTRIRVRAGARFTVGVETAAPRYTWRLDGRRGTARGRVLRLRAPAKRGRYRLLVAEHGHTATALVIVGAK